jgi:ABC-2 type transport system permease protein
MSTTETNVSPAGVQAEDASRAPGVGSLRWWDLLAVLIRRELWEHRALWLAPLLVAVLLVALGFVASFRFPHMGAGDPSALPGFQLYTAILWTTALPQFFVMAVVVNLYLLDCLYSERKDRSILFWKSLPVSDGMTVASKLLVALLVVPLWLFILMALGNLAMAAVLNMRAALGYLDLHSAAWDTTAWLRVEGIVLCVLLISALWYAPVAAYLAVLSAWARRMVFCWVTLPPLIAMYIEHSGFGTHHLYDFLRYRLTGIWLAMGLELATREVATLRAVDPGGAFTRHLAVTRVLPALANIDLWLGLAAAVALAFAAARIRRFRDDT